MKREKVGGKEVITRREMRREKYGREASRSRDVKGQDML